MDTRLLILIIITAMASLAMDAAIPPTKLNSNITWEFTDDGVLKVYGTGEIPDFKKEQKKAWNNHKDKFKGKTCELRAIEIGEGITRIGSYAFSGYLPGVMGEYIPGPAIPVKLPSTLRHIAAFAFYELNFYTTLPEGLETIGVNAMDHITGYEFVIPESVRSISSSFFFAHIYKLIIKGNTTFDNNHLFASFGQCKTIKEVVIYGSPTFNSHMFSFDSKIEFVVPDNYTLPEQVYRNLAKATILTHTQKIADKTVSGYVSNRMMAWDEYLSKKLSSSDEARAEIDAKLNKWQQKGEFESTADWKKRVTEASRKKFVDKLLAERKAEVEKVKNKYEAERNKLIDEFYNKLRAEAQREYYGEVWSIQTYDADNQTYLVTSKNHGDILLQVPIEEAQEFKTYWQANGTSAEYTFSPKDESSVALTKISFQPSVYSKTYSYTGKEDAKYSIADINYNFAPIEIEDIHYVDGGVMLADNSQATKTIATSGIQAKKVNVDRKSITAGNGGGTSTSVKKAAAKSDIDSNIPKATKTRENTFALVIANENYRRVSPVTFALNDGNAVARHLEIALGIPAKNIITVNDASLNDIQYNLRRLSDICEAYKGEASVIVYYAGHGVPDNASKDAFLLPVDGYAESVADSGVSLSQIMRTIEGMPTRSSVLLLDACFSGTSREGTMLAEARGVRIKAKANQAGGNLVVFSASQGDETAHPYTEKEHGMFTYFLLKKLGESRGEATLGELSQYVQDQVTRTSVVAGAKQTPTVSVSPQLTDWHNIKF